MKKFELFYPLDQWKITQEFGANDVDLYRQLGMKGHNGLDLVASDGEVVRAAHDGRVTFVGYDGTAGLSITIRTEEKYSYVGGEAYFKTVYLHLKKGSVLVTAGEKVNAGNIIARADNTGYSTGSHLHFGVKPIDHGEAEWDWQNVEQNNGYKGAIDPAQFLNGIYARKMGYYRFDRPIDFGASGRDVVELQDSLQAEGIYGGPLTGFYGDQTAKAVLAYQLKYNLPLADNELTGKRVGPKTLAQLNNIA